MSESAIIAIYLFGSSVKRHEKVPTDIDIALLLDEPGRIGIQRRSGCLIGTCIFGSNPCGIRFRM
ncbi:MAG: hypothetical protein JRF31_12275 [Deltaproteobacteria bacterium]|nr:hypothetical protein [Deltaproteobacteria bacterium]